VASSHEPLIERFLRGLDLAQTSVRLWIGRSVYVVGNEKLKAHIMEVRKVDRVHNSTAMAAPLESGVSLTVYDDNVVTGQHTYVVDYDSVRDYEYVLFLLSFYVAYPTSRSGLPLALLNWPKNASGRKPHASDFGLNPDYVLNHLRALYQENPPNHPNRCLFKNTDTMIYPQRRRFDDSGAVCNTPRPRTPPPTFNIWHETSFLESHWRVLEGIIIRYYERGSHNKRQAKVFAKANGLGFFMKHLRSGEKTAQVNWKWDTISYMNLTPIRASYRNRDFLWIILDGEYAGRYCKAVYAPLEPKPGESTTFFTIAFAHVLTGEGGERVTVVNTPHEEREIREDLIGVVWQTRSQRLAEPKVYIGASGMQKRGKEKRGTKRKRPEGG
jgi:hypothetical protein